MGFYFCLLSVVLICPRLSLKNRSRLVTDRSNYKEVRSLNLNLLFLIWTRRPYLYFLKTRVSNLISGQDAVQIWQLDLISLSALYRHIATLTLKDTLNSLPVVFILKGLNYNLISCPIFGGYSGDADPPFRSY